MNNKIIRQTILISIITILIIYVSYKIIRKINRTIKNYNISKRYGNVIKGFGDISNRFGNKDKNRKINKEGFSTCPTIPTSSNPKDIIINMLQ